MSTQAKTETKSIGIIGGMGPAATCDLMKKIIDHTDAPTDQEHIHIYVDCNTNIPDRTKALLYDGDSPVEELIKSGQKLQKMGADVLIMPCNTAHCFIEEIKPHFDIPMLNMIEETGKELNRQGFKKAAVLATDGTLQSNIYQETLSSFGIRTIYPEPAGQTHIMSLIYDYIKRGITDCQKLPVDAIRELILSLSSEAEIFILACTELPIAFEIMGLQNHIMDSTLILAKAAIRFAGKNVKE